MRGETFQAGTVGQRDCQFIGTSSHFLKQPDWRAIVAAHPMYLIFATHRPIA
jgi:hypothetical protein